MPSPATRPFPTYPHHSAVSARHWQRSDRVRETDLRGTMVYGSRWVVRLQADCPPSGSRPTFDLVVSFSDFLLC
ncbi:hypothetical protein GWI33_014616 [Rhynchophorus ferrugineus]|uniref:Uncharacterized protein n=1 Tax=Rhynchophorus ferrugineus TaxID=354439 RepID=A0A834I286_RHYFE|nr:hypothetical protein GWI33_014616 [Rhynchophorus ferrugineus]